MSAIPTGTASVQFNSRNGKLGLELSDATSSSYALSVRVRIPIPSTDTDADFACAARNGIGHQSIQADGSEQQRESRKETGEHGGDALFDKCAADDLGDRFGAERVFVSERLDPVAHGFCERFGRSVGAHYEIE